MCQLAQVSRASYYRHLEEEWRRTRRKWRCGRSIQEMVLTHRRRYGYRRVTAELHRRGMVINHKRVLRIMREDNLLAIRYRKYILTTDSQHDCQVYLNLAARMTVTGVNQLWVADITYIRLRTSLCFLAVVIDRYSRKAIGWALDRSLTARVAVTALQQAIAASAAAGSGASLRSGHPVCQRRIRGGSPNQPDGPEHEPSGEPYDNAACESFMKTLKQEEIYCNQYAISTSFPQHLEEFIDAYYNRLRLHSALGYRTPEEFERDAAATRRHPAAATMRRR
jgi:putative transposase